MLFDIHDDSAIHAQNQIQSPDITLNLHIIYNTQAISNKLFEHVDVFIEYIDISCLFKTSFVLWRGSICWEIQEVITIYCHFLISFYIQVQAFNIHMLYWLWH